MKNKIKENNEIELPSDEIRVDNKDGIRETIQKIIEQIYIFNLKKYVRNPKQRSVVISLLLSTNELNKKKRN